MMKDDAMERLARENPVSETLPGPPIEPLLRRLNQQPPAPAQPRRRPRRRRGAGGTAASVLAIAVALAVAAVAVIYVGHHRARVHPGNDTNAGSKHGLALRGGNCRTPAQINPLPIAHTRPPTAPDGLVREASGHISGIAWQLRAIPKSEIPGSTQHDQLLLGARRYGLCSQGSAPIPFGLINAGAHAIVYGYVANGAGAYRITISEGNHELTTATTDTFFFIRALPRPACSYRTLTATATSLTGGGLPPTIHRALDETATRFTTTMRLGTCRPHALVKVISERGQRQGRSPKAALSHVRATVNLTAAPGSHSHARGSADELTLEGLRGFRLLAVGLTPGRYGIWLLGAHHQLTADGAATVKHHELDGAYDLPADDRAHQFVLTAQAPGQTNTPGQVILRATLP
jgi:hypothetical protein